MIYIIGAIIIIVAMPLMAFIISLFNDTKNGDASKAYNRRRVDLKYRTNKGEESYNNVKDVDEVDEVEEDDEEMVNRIIDEDYYHYNDDRNCNESR